jgi:predicted RNA methylase
LGLAASTAAAISPADIVLEPSAGTGLLAILAELSGASLVLNELAEIRAELLSLLFRGIAVTRLDAAQIDDHLDPDIKPSVVLMNPPFSAVASVDRRMDDVALRHIASALARLPEGGRLVAITGASCSPDKPEWRDAFARFQECGRVVFTAAIVGAVFAKHGTTIETRLTVIDRLPAENATVFPSPPGRAPDVATLLGWITEHVPARLPIATAITAPAIARPVVPRTVRVCAMRPSSTAAPNSSRPSSSRTGLLAQRLQPFAQQSRSRGSRPLSDRR